ncbi:glycosyltransferase [Blautia obeum]|uniref:glycosyltransferase n=1 Tax=Blautia obeum TaxID=40520 RepID=UPI001A9AC0F7|nr:glycosyltransferase [Blautia obeum]
MNKIDVSIVVPLYNKENEIRRCLNSLIEQSVSNIEIIVVDDGSKDGRRIRSVLL